MGNPRKFKSTTKGVKFKISKPITPKTIKYESVLRLVRDISNLEAMVKKKATSARGDALRKLNSKLDQIDPTGAMRRRAQKYGKQKKRPGGFSHW